MDEQNEPIESKLQLPREWADVLKKFQEIEDHRPEDGEHD